MPAQEELTKEEKLERSLRNSIIDGAFFSLKSGLADSFFSAFAIFLGAGNLSLGLLDSLPLAVSSLLQLCSKRLVHLFKSRLRFICLSGLLHALSLFLIVPFYLAGWLNVYLLLILIVFYWIFDRLASPAWNSLMGDLVPESRRGSYFGKRNRVVYLSSFFGLILGGALLGLFQEELGNIGLGFVVIFSLGVLARLISLHYLRRMYEPLYESTPKHHFTLSQFLGKITSTNFGNFVLYSTIMSFSVHIAAPFFVAYFLRDVGLTYPQYTLVLGASVAVKFLTLPIWGKALDRYGTKKILSLAGLLMPFGPVLLSVSTRLSHIIAANIFTGFGWAGFELASFNYIMDSTSSEKRATCVSYHNLLSGLGILLGSLFGTYLLTHNTLFWSRYILVFVVSAILRLFSSIIFLPRIKEVRRVEPISYNRLFFNVLTLGPALGAVLRIITFNEQGIKKLLRKR